MKNDLDAQLLCLPEAISCQTQQYVCAHVCARVYVCACTCVCVSSESSLTRTKESGSCVGMFAHLSLVM